MADGAAQADNHAMATPTADDKAVSRSQLRARCRALPPTERHAQSIAACTALAAVLEAWDWPPLAAYMALPWELSLDPLLDERWAAGAVVWLPRVLGPGRLGWVAIDHPRQLAPGTHGIREPLASLPTALAPPSGTVLLAPGVGFTHDGRRLGQGGGFYDRALPVLTPVLRAVWGICLTEQLCDELPCAAHDARVERVLVAGCWWPAPPPVDGPSVACRVSGP